ncbi:MAG TPA: hypothetical protein VI934_00490, partial [Candidatus Nanoarchaeia archaeon]|nr:hypothetical protein [Candidatus Nanoarchaeia archaeon]
LGGACVGFGGISVIIGYAILNYFFPIKPDFVDAGIVVLGAVGGYGAFHYRNKQDRAAVK